MTKEAIFDVYSGNLRMLSNNGLLSGLTLKYEHTYICPLCLEQFNKSHLNSSLPIHLTFEDVPPRSLGGRANILTCNKCNNTCGTEVDYHLQAHIKRLNNSAFPEDKEMYVTVNQEGLELRGILSTNDRMNMTLSVSEKNNNSVNIEQFNSLLAKDPKFRKVTVKVRENKSIDIKRLSVALLKISYLLAFQKFGYLFILENRYNVIRDQIQKPVQDLYPEKFWSIQNVPDQHMLTGIILNKGIKSIHSSFKLIDNDFQIVVSTLLALPFPYNNIKSVLNNMNKFEELELEIRKPTDNFLKDLQPNIRFNRCKEQDLHLNLDRHIKVRNFSQMN